jgi:hypothetical protein
MRHDDAKTRQERRRAGAVGQRGEGAPYILFTHSEAGAQRVRIDADALELAEQLLESLFL